MAASVVSTSSRDASRKLTDATRAPVRGGLASAGFNCAAFHARLSFRQTRRAPLTTGSKK
jgi:hypothetical protein